MLLTTLRKHPYVSSIVGGLGVTLLSYLLALQAGWITSINPLEFFAVATSYVCTLLCIWQRRQQYFWGMFSTAAYAVLFFQQDLLASSLLNLLLTPYLILGFIWWGKDSNPRPVTNGTWRIFLLFAGIALAAFGITYWAVTSFGGTFALIDCAILALTIFSQLSMDRKLLYCWYTWIVVNVLGTTEYFLNGLPLVAIQQLLFLLISIWSWYEWKITVRRKINPVETHPEVELV